ncbi:MAG TPA: hypothetical protein ENI35_07265 [Candidatus Desulfofervidus auxilii]|uniref:Uncharacterized protein n=1 Tax=Desulfofervidus auxilii TaxID=1621989 RepID=A0A7C1ZN00_DESA2|nr:hypothetical protein [Candidatus Desulfofervidus auxilii]
MFFKICFILLHLPACAGRPARRQAGGFSFKVITDFEGSETQIEISPNLKLKNNYLPCADLNKNFIRLKNPAVTVE